jgi:preprotein translocase SecE subunit
MPLGIYKPGQGYWVRVLTATFAGVLLLAASAWLWGQLELASGWIPVRNWEVTVRPAEGIAEPGASLVLLGEPRRAGDPVPQIGTGEVRSIEPLTAGVRVEITGIDMAAGHDPTQIRSIGPPPTGEATLSGPVVGTPLGRPIFDPLFLQAAGVGFLILLGAGFIFYYIGSKPGSVEFLIATDGEMKKVNWSTRKDILGSTWVVIVWSAMIASGLFIVDLAFSRFFIFVGILER